MKSVAVITSGRADYGLLRPIMKAIDESTKLDLMIFVTGAHLSSEFGDTWREIEEDGFNITEKIHDNKTADTPAAIASSMGMATSGFSRAFDRTRPDIILVLGDRHEIFAAASAAVPMRIALAHVHGGESTLGSVDDIFRHCLTKMSHLHFVSCEQYKQRVIQLGEEPWRVTVSGAPGLDNLKNTIIYSPEDFFRKFGIPIKDGTLLVTFHPESIHPQHTRSQIYEILSALETANRPTVFTYPNADAAGKTIISALRHYCDSHHDAWLAIALGTRGYITVMSKAAAMIGNSSSGIIEAASFKLPVVNVGIRQSGRQKASNVIDVSIEHEAIKKAITKATSFRFRSSLDRLKNPFGDGNAARRIVDVLERTELDETLLVKKFHDLSTRQGALKCG